LPVRQLIFQRTRTMPGRHFLRPRTTTKVDKRPALVLSEHIYIFTIYPRIVVHVFSSTGSTMKSLIMACLISQ
jgi:hypothetical protein